MLLQRRSQIYGSRPTGDGLAVSERPNPPRRESAEANDQQNVLHT